MTSDCIRQFSLSLRRVKHRRTKRRRIYNYELARRLKVEGPIVLGSNVLPFEPATRIDWSWGDVQRALAKRDKRVNLGPYRNWSY